MEYYSALQNKEILTHVTGWLNLNDLMLSLISYSQIDRYCYDFTMEGRRAVRVMETGSRGEAGGRGERTGSFWGKNKGLWRPTVAVVHSNAHAPIPYHYLLRHSYNSKFHDGYFINIKNDSGG